VGSKVLSVNGLDTLTAHASGYGDDNTGKGEQRETYQRERMSGEGGEAVDVLRRRAGRTKKRERKVVKGKGLIDLFISPSLAHYSSLPLRPHSQQTSEKA
jgi:hypothetical protein